jgi:two-component system, NarL family, nitrate/nitrite response regulator NarL
VLIADDHPIFCAGVRALLEVDGRLAVVGEARNGHEAVEMTLGLEPDVAFLDLQMPVMGGLEALAEIRRRGSPARVVMLTAAIDRKQIFEALRLGARGVLLKDAAPELLHRSVQAVLAGQYWVGQESMSDLVQYLCDLSAGPRESRRYGLTPREREIVAAVADGLTNRDIARQLSRSEDTIKHHLSNVFDKVGVSNRLELALFAIEHDLVESRRAG